MAWAMGKEKAPLTSPLTQAIDKQIYKATQPPKAPDPADPSQLAAAQTGTNISTAIANALLGQTNQNTPYGSLSYRQTGSSTFTDPTTGQTYTIPQFTQDMTLSQAGQAQQNQLDRAGLNLSTLAADQSGRIGDMLATPVSTDGLPELTTDFSADRQKVEDALMARMNPYLTKAREDAERGLSNRGVKLGSAAYDTGMDAVGRSENDARMAAILNAGQEQSRLAALQSQARSQGLGERFAMRNQPINEITALMTGGQVTQPSFGGINSPSMPTTDYAGLFNNSYNQQMNQYNQRSQQQQSNMGALAGLGSAALLAFSDEGLKTDKKRIGKVAGLGLYEYRMRNEPKTAPKRMGVMAQEVEKVHPDAVVDTPIGKAVDYGKIGLAGLARLNVEV